jgi:hypothetical protein
MLLEVRIFSPTAPEPVLRTIASTRARGCRGLMGIAPEVRAAA